MAKQLNKEAANLSLVKNFMLLCVHSRIALPYFLAISVFGVPCSKPLGGSKVDSAFHPSEVDKMSTRNLWELSGEK